MPANLPPHYYDADKRFRDAKDPAEKVTALEAMLAIMPHHKGTDKLQYARIWGSGKFDGQRVQRDYVLQDGDIIELHM